MIDLQIIWPVAGAIVAGALIGLEREYRASAAGFRTHILVSLSSSLLMLAAVHQIHWLTDTPADVIRIDPVRMAHGILTGIGFLCGGVIFREGLTVRGLTTAASLWFTSAIGILFGVGFFGLGALGTFATLLVLAAVSLTGALLPQRRYAEIKVRYRPDAAITMAGFRLALCAHALNPRKIDLEADVQALTFTTMVSGYRETRIDALAATLRKDESVLAFECRARSP
ncbi:MgtC/SapB family protein [Brevundimonas sp. M1A4_2e]|nr:MgtC/SapB family protein [Brevundimonas naejangsanensis]MCB7501134.1 MgtC/SapB family protein [Enterobacter roggenkampii]